MNIWKSCFVIGALITAPAALAEKRAEPEWQHQLGKFVVMKYSSVKSTIPTEYLWVDVADRPGGVLFMCGNKDFLLIVDLDGQGSVRDNVTELITHDSGSQTMLRPQYIINGKRSSNSQWHYSTRAGAIMPLRPSIAKKVYNSAIRDETVELKRVRGIEDFTLTLPKPNKEFAEFGGECGLGLNAVKNQNDSD